MVAERIDLLTWLNQLTRYRENKALPKSFKTSLTDFFTYYYKSNRNIVIYEEGSPLFSMPRYLKQAIVIGYVYDDIISDFRRFFRPDLYLDCGLLEDLI